MRVKTNKIVRIALYEHSVTQKELASLIGIGTRTLSYWLAKEQPEEVQKEWVNLIEREANRKAAV